MQEIIKWRVPFLRDVTHNMINPGYGSTIFLRQYIFTLLYFNSIIQFQIKLCVCIGKLALLRCMSCLPHASLNFCTPHLTFELYMLGSKGCERMPLVSSCEINKEKRLVKSFLKISGSHQRFPKTDDFKNYIILIKKSTTWHGHQ